MSAFSVLLLPLLLKYHIVDGYYVSPSKLNMFAANAFCLDHCQFSHLASMHNDNENMNAIYQSRNISYLQNPTNDDIWIGLTAYFIGSFEFLDGSSWNYGTANNYGNYPWAQNKPVNTKSFSVKINTNNLWEDENSDEKRRFICNTCNGVINKYFVYKALLSWSNAQTYCINTIGTDLASYHSDRDIEEAHSLCGTGACWIGLNDIATEGSYAWSDGTSFVYGDNAEGIEPWDELQPNSTAGDCVSLHDYTKGGIKTLDAHWRVSHCDKDTRWVLCALPHELCAFKAISWNVLYGNMISNNCDLILNEDTMTIIDDKVWNNQNGTNGDVLVIEYMFRLEIPTASGNPNAGVMVYNLPDLCDYYYIYVWTNGPNSQLIISKFIGGNETVLTQKTVTFGLYVFRTMRIQITNGNQFDIYIDNTQTISSYIDSGQIVVTNSSRIGLKNSDITLLAKSLYVSGTITMQYTAYIGCIAATTATPTMSPSVNPSISPLAAGQTYEPSVSPITTIPTSSWNTLAVSTANTISPTNIPSVTPTTDNTLDGNDEEKWELFGLDDMTLNIILGVIGLILCCLCCIVCIYFRKLVIAKKKKKEFTVKMDKNGSLDNIKHLKMRRHPHGSNEYIINHKSSKQNNCIIKTHENFGAMNEKNVNSINSSLPPPNHGDKSVECNKLNNKSLPPPTPGDLMDDNDFERQQSGSIASMAKQSEIKGIPQIQPNYDNNNNKKNINKGNHPPIIQSYEEPKNYITPRPPPRRKPKKQQQIELEPANNGNLNNKENYQNKSDENEYDQYKAPYIHPPIATDFGDNVDDEFSKDSSYNNDNKTMSPDGNNNDNDKINIQALPKRYEYDDEGSDGSDNELENQSESEYDDDDNDKNKKKKGNINNDLGSQTFIIDGDSISEYDGINASYDTKGGGDSHKIIQKNNIAVIPDDEEVIPVPPPPPEGHNIAQRNLFRTSGY